MTEWITTSDGVRLAYHHVGAGDPPIVFVHGIYGNREAPPSRRSTSHPITGAWLSTCAAMATATSPTRSTRWPSTPTTWPS